MFFGGFYLDPVYLFVFIVTLVISIAAQAYMSSQYRKWSNVRNGSSLNGQQVGYAIVNRTSLGGDGTRPAPRIETGEVQKLAQLHDKGIITDAEFQAKRQQLEATRPARQDTSYNASNIAFEQTQGQLSDHYDPRSHTVRMSQKVASQPSVASMAIVAHELGHAQQHENNSVLITMRNVLLPAVRFSPTIAFISIFLGLLFNIAGLFWLGVIFYALLVLFSILTLPVEIDASRRGLKLLDKAGLMVTEQDRQGSKGVLTAAAATYIAAAVTAILQLLYYISIARRRG
jgi:Zn-dependent membrane protease YugP